MVYASVAKGLHGRIKENCTATTFFLYSLFLVNMI